MLYGMTHSYPKHMYIVIGGSFVSYVLINVLGYYFDASETSECEYTSIGSSATTTACFLTMFLANVSQYIWFPHEKMKSVSKKISEYDLPHDLPHNTSPQSAVQSTIYINFIGLISHVLMFYELSPIYTSSFSNRPTFITRWAEWISLVPVLMYLIHGLDDVENVSYTSIACQTLSTIT